VLRRRRGNKAAGEKTSLRAYSDSDNLRSDRLAGCSGEMIKRFRESGLERESAEEKK